jgi:hypothetical protein
LRCSRSSLISASPASSAPAGESAGAAKIEANFPILLRQAIGLSPAMEHPEIIAI